MKKNLVNAKLMDAIEFVKPLPGGWDCIVWDPPYLPKKSHCTKIIKKKMLTQKNRWSNKKQHRMLLQPEYLEKLQELIKSKTENYFWLNFYNKQLEAEYNVNWYKGKRHGGLGGKIRRNTEYIMIDRFGKIESDSNYYLYETEEIPQHPTDDKLMAKPILLYKKIFRFCGATNVLDPFAGSYNSAKACYELGIKIDTCDKYEKPQENGIYKKGLLDYSEIIKTPKKRKEKNVNTTKL